MAESIEIDERDVDADHDGVVPGTEVIVGVWGEVVVGRVTHTESHVL